MYVCRRTLSTVGKPLMMMPLPTCSNLGTAIPCRNESVAMPQHFKDSHVPSFLSGFNLTLSPLQWLSNETTVLFDTCQVCEGVVHSVAMSQNV